MNTDKLNPVGDMIGEALENIMIDSCSLDCTDRPSCPCPKCQARLLKMLKDSARRIENERSPLNRAQRRALKKRKRR